MLLNFVFCKSGLVTRIYGDGLNGYAAFLEALPDKMIKSVEKAPVCKLCNIKCAKGYVFSVRGEQHQKCRYNCFMFEVNDESIPFARTFIGNEIKERSA